MATMNQAISTAIKTQATRANIEISSLAESLGISRSSLYYRLNDKTPWNVAELDAIAKALKLPNAWELFALAETERRLEAVA